MGPGERAPGRPREAQGRADRRRGAGVATSRPWNTPCPGKEAVPPEGPLPTGGQPAQIYQAHLGSRDGTCSERPQPQGPPCNQTCGYSPGQEDCPKAPGQAHRWTCSRGPFQTPPGLRGSVPTGPGHLALPARRLQSCQNVHLTRTQDSSYSGTSSPAEQGSQLPHGGPGQPQPHLCEALPPPAPVPGKTKNTKRH